MAGEAFERRSREPHPDMAIRTGNRTMTPEEGEPRFIMIDAARQVFDRLPGLGVVTVLALLCESDELVVRLRRAVEIGEVAALAFQRQTAVLTIDMAGLADSALMRTGQPETRETVIEFRRTPGGQLMTALTVA